MLRSRASSVVLVAASLALATALVACNNDSGGSGGGGGSSSSGGTGGATGGSSAGTGGTACTSGGIIGGTVTYPEGMAAGAKDVLRIAVVKDGKPGIPSGLANVPNPSFPLQYKITALPVDATAGSSSYGVYAYLDFGGGDLMGPGAEDPQFVSDVVQVKDCEEVTVDVVIPPPPAT